MWPASGLSVNALTRLARSTRPLRPTPTAYLDRDATFSQFQPKVTWSWNAADDINVYASWGVGFRSGGFNSIGSEALIDLWYNDNGDGTNPGALVDGQLSG